MRGNGGPWNGCNEKSKLGRSKPHESTHESRVEPLAKTVAVNKPTADPAKRHNRLTPLRIVAPKKAKLSRSATLTNLPTDTDDDLSHPRPKHIEFLQQKDMCLQSAKDVRRKRWTRGLKCPTTYKRPSLDPTWTSLSPMRY